jgi:glutamine synthetase
MSMDHAGNNYIQRVRSFSEDMVDYVQNHVPIQHGVPSGLSLKTNQEVVDYVREHEITSIRLWFTDVLGFLKKFEITPAELEGAFEEGMGFDGSSVEGYQRIQESDMVAFPIANTAEFIPFPVGPARCIRMFAEINTPEGGPYPGDPRVILQRTLKRLDDHGFSHMNIGPEAEFFYFKADGTPTVLDHAGYFDMVPVDVGDDFREATRFALQAMNIQVEYMHHEVAHSQHEIDLKYAEALTMADNLQTYKWLVKEIARRNGIHATFMPKPLENQNGSGMHVHLSIFEDEERNAFYSKEDPHHLSQTARYFLAGVLRHSQEMCLITNQWYNSYKRLVPGYEAPVYIAWAQRNRSALVRLPTYKPGKEVATRIELRFPDAACNPYLAFSVMLAAGLRGVEEKYDLAEPVADDLYHYTPMQREQKGIESLPHDLYDAVQKASHSELLRETLGSDVLDKLIETKLNEYESYRLHVSHREIEESLNL